MSNETQQAGAIKVAPVYRCPMGDHPIFTYANGAIVPHYAGDGNKCPASGTKYDPLGVHQGQIGQQDAGACRNCQHDMRPEWDFCPHCGQESAALDIALSDYAGEQDAGACPTEESIWDRLMLGEHTPEDVQELRALEAERDRLREQWVDADCKVGLRDAEIRRLRAGLEELLIRAYKYDDKPHQLYSWIRQLAEKHPSHNTPEIVRLMDKAYNRKDLRDVLKRTVEALEKVDATLCECRWEKSFDGCNCDIHASHRIIAAALSAAKEALK